MFPFLFIPDFNMMSRLGPSTEKQARATHHGEVGDEKEGAHLVDGSTQQLLQTCYLMGAAVALLLKMSTELYSACDPHGDNTNLHSTTVGGSKPLHRFIRGQPKIIGIVLLVLGSSFFILSIAMLEVHLPQLWRNVSPGFWLGGMFISCGIIYILTEHNPTKKTVTISLALSIVALLGAIWGAFISILPGLLENTLWHYDFHYNSSEHVEDDWSAHYEVMIFILEVIFEFYIIVGAAIFIVMSSLAGAALRSTKSQALVVMSTIPTE